MKRLVSEMQNMVKYFSFKSSKIFFFILFGVIILTLGASNAGEVINIKWEKDANIGVGFKAPLELKNGDILAWREIQLQPEGGKMVGCYKSSDSGVTWSYLSEIVRDNDTIVDLGDGAFVQLSNGDILFSYRHNKYINLPATKRTYRIEMAISKDKGQSWQFHSTVMNCGGSNRGLWSSFLLEKDDGTLQCYYDDEYTPSQQGFDGHQWAQMKTWDPESLQWVNPVTVSRAHNPVHLSRDGMCSVVELSKNKLLCALESVQTSFPYRGLIRYVTSNDGGKTWSWEKEKRYVLYQPEDTTFNALAPWMIMLRSGALLCVFTTDEDRKKSGVPSTGILYQDLKYMLSYDNGKNWSKKPYIIDDDYPIFFPGVCELKYGANKGILLVQYFHKHRVFNKKGSVEYK